MSLVLEIPTPCLPLNSNQRLHYRTQAERTKKWREAAQVAVRARWKVCSLSHAHVTCHLHFTDNRRRDAGNWYPTAKAILDGLVDAGVLPDDNDKHVVGPDLRRGEKADAFRVTVSLDLDCDCRDCIKRWGIPA